MTDVSEVLEWHGRTVVATDGDKLGKIEQIYFDQETNRPEWALIDTGMFAGKSSFMPLQGATSDGEQVTAAYSKDQVKALPRSSPPARSPRPKRPSSTATTESSTASRARAAGCPRQARPGPTASRASPKARGG